MHLKFVSKREHTQVTDKGQDMAVSHIAAKNVDHNNYECKRYIYLIYIYISKKLLLSLLSLTPPLSQIL